MEAQNPRDRIKREAMRLFARHGVDAVSMRDIVVAAGMKAPSLYAHFRSLW
jgi:AcrR family transcriptional regulator